MAYGTLLQAGAEAVAMGVVTQIPWQTDSQGRQVRRPLSSQERTTIENRVRARLGGRALTPRERSELGNIVSAADNANRRAHQLARPGRLPRPHEIDRLPGTGNAGGQQYYYTVAVQMIDRRTGERRTFTLVVTDGRIMTAAEVMARAQEAITANDITQRMGSGAPNLRRATIEGMDVVSVYRGSPEI